MAVFDDIPPGDDEVRGDVKRTDEGGVPSDIRRPLSHRSIWRLYCSRFLTAWGDRLWSFGLGLLLYKLRPQDLMLVSIYGLVNCLSSILFGASIGNWIDRTRRLTAAKCFLVVQNVSVAVACSIVASYFQWTSELTDIVGDSVTHIVTVLVMAMAIVSTLASMGSRIVVEKDWIVVIADGDHDTLARMNSTFRTIDLTCLTLTPTLAGVLFSFTSYLFVAVGIAVWNLVSVFLEFLLLISIYSQFPALSSFKPTSSHTKGPLVALVESFRGWQFYFSHSTVLAGLGLSLLYMTVLGFDATTWAFILMQCVSEAVLGAMVTISAAVGVLGSLAFPFLRRLLGVERSAVAGVWALVASITLCVASIWLQGSPFDPFLDDKGEAESCDNLPLTSVSVLLTGIILARFGLWVTDLSVSQTQQEQVSLNQLFDLAKFFFVILMPRPQRFGLLVIFSFTFIFLGAVSITVYAGIRGKLSSSTSAHDCSTYQPSATQDPSTYELTATQDPSTYEPAATQDPSTYEPAATQDPEQLVA